MALNLFAMGDFALVITDLQMPVMAGNELAVSIKGLASTLPILMITPSEWARGGADNPVDALLNKPVTVSDLRCALGELLSAPPDPVRDEAGWVPSTPWSGSDSPWSSSSSALASTTAS